MGISENNYIITNTAKSIHNTLTALLAQWYSQINVPGGMHG